MIWVKCNDIQKTPRNDHLWIVYGTNSLADHLPFNDILTVDELIYAERLKGPGQKSTWLSCRATLRLILASYLSLNPQVIEFKKGRFGKLYVANCNLFFNVSHSTYSFLLGFNPLGRIGVDMEKLSGREDLPSLIQYAFSEKEADYCIKGDSGQRFTEIWTLKEAFLKAVGVGLVDQLPSINTYGLENNLITKLYLNSKSFICPNGETANIVFKKSSPIIFNWYNPHPSFIISMIT